MTPKRVYDEYSPYLLAKPPKKKKKDDQTGDRRDAIIGIGRDLC